MPLVTDRIEEALDLSNCCKYCQNRLKTTHTYRTPGGKVQNRVCDTDEGGCGATYTATIIVSLSENTKRGEGAYAVAKKLRSHNKGSNNAPD